MKTWLGLDIGGANVKAAHCRGGAESRRFPLWKQPDQLPVVLSELIAGFPRTDGVALTMTAELCDCFETKAIGVRAILRSVQSVVGERPVRIWGVDGGFHTIPAIEDDPLRAAASNWLALATVAARSAPSDPALLIDVGSTTTDLIPLQNGRPRLPAIPDGPGRPAVWTDLERLRTGMLVYAGVRRTPLCALASRLNWRGALTGLAAELFATTLDVYLTLKAIPSDPADRDTADGRPATLSAARDRLARMVCEDRDGFSELDAIDLAQAADTVLVDRLVASAQDLAVGPYRSAIVSGSGEFLARRVAERVVEPGRPVISLSEIWGPAASVAACAFAVATLAEERE